jgi:hypothetical protein
MNLVESWWGNTSNNISWGKSYFDLANNTASNYNKRVIADGGTVEALNCINI